MRKLTKLLVVLVAVLLPVCASRAPTGTSAGAPPNTGRKRRGGIF